MRESLEITHEAASEQVNRVSKRFMEDMIRLAYESRHLSPDEIQGVQAKAYNLLIAQLASDFEELRHNPWYYDCAAKQSKHHESEEDV